jgi:phosphatidylinositol alpha-1,6-mannosyltransferase
MASILLVSELFPPVVGGSATLFGHVYGRLQEFGVTVLTPSPSTGRVDGVEKTFTIRPAEIDGRYRGIRPAAALRQHLRLAAAIRAEARAGEVALVHCARPLPEGLAAYVATFGRPPLPRYVSWVHGEDLAAALTSREHRWLANRVCHGAAAIVANSVFTSRIVAGLGVASDRIHVIHPGVDPSRFAARPDGAPQPSSDASGRLSLLSVGRLQRRKGHDRVIEAVAALRHRWPVAYKIAGDGEERTRLEALALRLGVADLVEFLGPVSDERLPGLYAACDVFVLPNRTDGHDVEGFGIVFLEAAAAERPTIGGKSGGVPEAVADGETGILVDGSRVDEIVSAIATLAATPALRERMGRAGRVRVLRAFTWDHAAARLGDLQRHLVAQVTPADEASLATPAGGNAPHP